MNWKDLASLSRLEAMLSAIDLVGKWQEATYIIALLENPDEFYQEKERIATLLVDNHLGKIARKVRMLGQGPDGLTSDQFLDQWAEISFIISLWKRFDSLSEGLKLNLIYQSGPNITKRHLEKLKGFRDQFLVVGRRFQMEEQLLQRSVYVYGMKHERFYLILDYSFNRQPFDYQFQVGELYEGEAVLYPFPGSLRLSFRSTSRIQGIRGMYDRVPVVTVEKAVNEFYEALKINPFCDPYPVIMNLKTDYIQEKWMVLSLEGKSIRVREMDERVAEVFHAVGFRRPTRMLVLMESGGVRPISFFNGERFLEFGTFAGGE